MPDICFVCGDDMKRTKWLCEVCYRYAPIFYSMVHSIVSKYRTYDPLYISMEMYR